MHNLNNTRISQWSQLYSDYYACAKLPPIGEGLVKFANVIADIRQLIEEYTGESPWEVVLIELNIAVSEDMAFNFLWELKDQIDLVEHAFDRTREDVWQALDSGFIPTKDKFEQLNKIQRYMIVQYLMFNDPNHTLRDKMNVES